MKAVGIRDFGGPETLEVLNLPDPPAPEKGAVRIRVRSAAVNPADVAMRSARGPAQPPSPPTCSAWTQLGWSSRSAQALTPTSMSAMK